jgi:2-polyprenyl-3-methyl-5-hydroxy-6-metoxy-1,4-benzoquinol methylase
MRFFKRGYDKNYFNTATDFNFVKKIDANSKVKLIRSIKPEGKLLEIGCGDGHLLKELQTFYSVCGFDISPSAIEKAKQLTGNKNLKVMNLEKKRITGKYDIILAFDVLEHLKEPEKSIIKIKNSLKKDGVFIFSVPNNYGVFGKIMTRIFNFIDKTHISTYPRRRWIEILEGHGFYLDIRGQSLFGIIKSEMGKHISYNLLVIAKK